MSRVGSGAVFSMPMVLWESKPPKTTKTHAYVKPKT